MATTIAFFLGLAFGLVTGVIVTAVLLTSGGRK